MMKSWVLALLLFSFPVFAASPKSPDSCRVGITPQARPPYHRGMYVSLYASTIGKLTLAKLDQNILGNKKKENEVLTLIAEHSIDSLAFYDLSKILPNPTLAKALSVFMDEARKCGVIEFQAVGGIESHWIAAKKFNDTYPNKFTGLLTEIEFWNNPNSSAKLASFNEFLDILKSMKKYGLKISVYLGWLNRVPGISEENAAQMISQYVDRVYLHCYVKDPVSAYSYCSSRVKAFQSSPNKIEIWPLFSAEGKGYSAGAETFMGEWITKNSLDSAEMLFNASYNGLPQSGFQYYEYVFLRHYVK